MRRRPPAEEHRVDLDRRLDPPQLDRQRLEIRPDEIITPCDEREVAIPAAMPAEGNVNVDGAVRHSSSACPPSASASAKISSTSRHSTGSLNSTASHEISSSTM